MNGSCPALANHACIITGAGRGIGRATAVRLSAAGARVMAAARTAAELDETVRSCTATGGTCVAQVTDVSRPPELIALIERCRGEFGRIDALINNAGVAPLASLETMNDESFEQVLDVNVRAIFCACRAAWPDLKASRGTIINLSSVAADDPFPGFSVYGATKAWVNTFTRSIAGEGRPFGIRAFAVAPGAVETEMLRGLFPEFPADQTLQPDDVAAVIEMLLDRRASAASGETIRVRR